MQLKLILIVLNSKFILNKCQHSSLFKTKKTKLYNFKNDIWDITNLNRTLKSFKPTIFSKVCLKHSIFNYNKKKYYFYLRLLLLQTVTNLVAHVLDHDVLQALVQLVPVLVQHHGVRVPVQLLERQPAVVLLLYFLDGLLQQRPDVRHVLVVHRHLLVDVAVISFVIFFYECNLQRFDVNYTFYLQSL